MLLSEIGLSIPLFERGSGGVPTSNYHGIDVAVRAESYEHAIAARGGFESLRTGFACETDEAIDILNTWLGRSTIATGPEGQTIWEGQLVEITANLGQRRRSVALEGMSNRVRVRYSQNNAAASVTSAASDADSIAAYGTRDAVIAIGATTPSAAADAASRALAQWKNPIQRPSTQIATGDQGEVGVELLFKGWYWTLGWVLTSRTSATVTATGTQIGDLIQTSGVGIGTVNAFLNTSRATIGATGRSDTEFIADDTTYLSKIEKLVGLGDGTDRWVLLCLEGRQLTFRKWAGADPSSVTYIAPLGDHAVYTPAGALVPPWDVRPDAMYQEVGLLDAFPVGSAFDTATRQYVERVVCRVDQNGTSVTLEPAAQDSLDVLLAALGG